ncbi:MAG: TonB family protein [Bacteroidota bacterium]
MSETIALVKNDVYGAFELKKLYPRNFAIGVAVAIFFHFLAIGSYYFYQAVTKEDVDNAPVVRVLKYSELGPPPSVTSEVPPQISVAGPVAKPTVGVPVPVPDEEAPPEQTIATQQEMSQQAAPSLGADFGTGQAQIQQDIKIETDEEPDMNAFVAVEKLPEMVVSAKPEYPEIAKRAGITGRVWVKVLVDKEGKPKKAVVFKTDSELFNQAAIDAAMKSAFTPALQNNHPIAVWIVLPYKFQLAE